MLLIGLLARLQLRRLDGIAYLIDLGPGEPLVLELIEDLAYSTLTFISALPEKATMGSIGSGS